MMNKFLNTKVLYIFISVIILIMFFLLVMRACSQKQPIQATVTPSDPVVGEEIFFSDSTSGARIWYWEFGNNETSTQRSGYHRFKQKGVYKIRLTVNGNLERYFDVRVKEKTNAEDLHLVHIIAPKEAIQGENLFTGIVCVNAIGNENDAQNLIKAVNSYKRYPRCWIEILPESKEYGFSSNIHILLKESDLEHEFRSRKCKEANVFTYWEDWILYLNNRIHV